MVSIYNIAEPIYLDLTVYNVMLFKKKLPSFERSFDRELKKIN